MATVNVYVVVREGKGCIRASEAEERPLYALYVARMSCGVCRGGHTGS